MGAISSKPAFFHLSVTFNIEHWDLWIKACYDIGGVYDSDDMEVDTLDKYRNLCGTAEQAIDELKFLSKHNNTILNEPIRELTKEIAFCNAPDSLVDMKKLVGILSACNSEYSTNFDWKLHKSFEDFIYPNEKYEISWSEIDV